METNRKSLLASAIAGALGAAFFCGAGVARAQDYHGPEAYGPSETVIVNPHYDRIQTENLIGRYDGEINPAVESISHPVSYSNLDLSRGSDRAELRYRIRDTAENLCASLENHSPGLRDSDSHRECVRDAVQDAMDQVR
jgi:UrcA family protein